MALSLSIITLIIIVSCTFGFSRLLQTEIIAIFSIQFFSLLIFIQSLGMFIASIYVDSLIRKIGLFRLVLMAKVCLIEIAIAQIYLSDFRWQIFLFLLFGFFNNILLLCIQSVVRPLVSKFLNPLMSILMNCGRAIGSLILLVDKKYHLIIFLCVFLGSFLPYTTINIKHKHLFQIEGKNYNSDLLSFIIYYNYFFWICFLFFLMENLLNTYLIIVLYNLFYSSSITLLVLLLFSFYMGKLLLYFPFQWMSYYLSPRNKLIFMCLLSIICFLIILNFRESNLIFGISLFLLGGITTDLPLQDYFFQLKKTKHLSWFITSNQIRNVVLLCFSIVGIIAIQLDLISGLFKMGLFLSFINLILLYVNV